MLLSDIKTENGWRVVTPYYFQYKIPAKGRWFGKTLVEWCCSEFGEDQASVIDDIVNDRMYVMSLCGRKGGPLRVDGWQALCDRPLAAGDLIHRTKHIHEPPVPNPYNIEIVHQDDNLLVVYKPSGIPTHPSGNYHFNSVTEILKLNLSLTQVWPCHRLDKVTSGVLVLGKTKEAGTAFSTIIQNEKSTTRKVYVARVLGKFPYALPVLFTSPVFNVNGKGSYITPSPHQVPMNSSTVFERLDYDPTTNHSIVRCRPLTGRTHQIRIHLRNMGFPIANDYVYNPSDPKSAFFAHNKAKLNIEHFLYDKLYAKYPELNQVTPVTLDLKYNQSPETIDIYKTIDWDTDPELQKMLARMARLRDCAVAHLISMSTAKCDQCGSSQFSEDTNTATLRIWLHALQFLYKDQVFETSMPPWCDFQSVTLTSETDACDNEQRPTTRATDGSNLAQ